MKIYLRFNAACLCILTAAFFSLTTNAHAQSRTITQQGNRAILPLPYGIDQLVAIDAHNSLIAQISPEAAESDTDLFRGIIVNHVYAGGIARLFGGVAVPAASLVSPAFNGNAAPPTISALATPSQQQDSTANAQAHNNIFQQGTIRR